MRLLAGVAAAAGIAVLVAAQGVVPQTAEQPVTEDPSTIKGAAGAQRKTFELWHSRATSGIPRAPAPAGQADGSERPKPESRQALIWVDGDGGETPAPSGGWCESGVPQGGTVDCEADLVAPTWRRFVYPDGTATSWERLDEGSCGPVIPVLTVEDFRSLPIPAPALRLQPDRGWVLVNIETIVMTDATPVPLRTTLGGFGIDVEAVPVRFVYDFGDGHELVTRSPGHAHPDHDTFHEYEEPGTYAITLTTEVGRPLPRRR